MLWADGVVPLEVMAGEVYCGISASDYLDAEEATFDLVPLAGARRQVTHGSSVFP
jgi:hypothetical protein